MQTAAAPSFEQHCPTLAPWPHTALNCTTPDLLQHAYVRSGLAAVRSVLAVLCGPGLHRLPCPAQLHPDLAMHYLTWPCIASMFLNRVPCPALS